MSQRPTIRIQNLTIAPPKRRGDAIKLMAIAAILILALIAVLGLKHHNDSVREKHELARVNAISDSTYHASFRADSLQKVRTVAFDDSLRTSSKSQRDQIVTKFHALYEFSHADSAHIDSLGCDRPFSAIAWCVARVTLMTEVRDDFRRGTSQVRWSDLGYADEPDSLNQILHRLGSQTIDALMRVHSWPRSRRDVEIRNFHQPMYGINFGSQLEIMYFVDLVKEYGAGCNYSPSELRSFAYHDAKVAAVRYVALAAAWDRKGLLPIQRRAEYWSVQADLQWAMKTYHWTSQDIGLPKKLEISAG